MLRGELHVNVITFIISTNKINCDIISKELRKNITKTLLI